MFLSIDASGQLREFEVKPGQTVTDAVCEELGITNIEQAESFVPRYITRAMDVPCVVMIGVAQDQEAKIKYTRNDVASVLWAYEDKEAFIYGTVVLCEGSCDGLSEQAYESFGKTRNAVEKIRQLTMVLPFE